MPVTQLDTRTALVVVDLQNGIIANPMAHPVADVLKNAGELAAAFRRHGLPVVLVTVAGAPPGRVEEKRPLKQEPGWDELAPELDRQPGDHRVIKRSWGAFSGTELKEWLDRQGVTQIVLAGVSTSIGVESTARQAYEGGFHVTAATDAMTDTKGEAHTNSLTRIFPRLGETGSTAEIIRLLEKDQS